MLQASTSSPLGICTAVPDTCHTPSPSGTVPTPYPNVAMLQQAIAPTLAQTVKIAGFHAATTMTQIMMSTGDEGGTAGGGVKSATIKGPCKFKMGSKTVKFMGQSAVHIGSLIAQNNSLNANMPAGVQVSPSQVTVTVGP